MIDIKATRELCDKATPGPWTVAYSEGDCGKIGSCPKNLCECDENCPSCDEWVWHQGAFVPQVKTIDWGDFTDMNDADAEFIAQSRTLIPALLDALEQTQNRRYQEPNEPLTLEQLREMDGEPVWIDGKDYGGWTIFKAGANKQVARCLDNVNLSYYMADYSKTWIAYRRKPESEGTN